MCTFILSEYVMARRRERAQAGLGLTAVRLQMVGIATMAGGVAHADPHVVGLVLTAFRVFVPGVVPQAVLTLLNRRTKPGALAASIIAGPAVSLALAHAFPGLQETPADPVL